MSYEALRTALKAGADQKLAEANSGLDELVAAYRKEIAKPDYDRTTTTARVLVGVLDPAANPQRQQGERVEVSWSQLRIPRVVRWR